MEKEKIKQQRAKLKENALKVLHVLCYILSGLFLVCLLISALQSCKHESVSAESEVNASQDYVTLKYQGTGYEFNNEELVTLNTITGTPNSEYPLADEGNIVNYYIFDLRNAKGIYNGEYVEVTQLWASFMVYDMPNGDYYARLYKVFVYSEPNNRYIDLVTKSENQDGVFDYKYEFTTNGFYLCPPLELTEKDQALFQYFFKNATPNGFTFNKVFNYNAPLGLGLSQQFGANISYATDIGGIYRITINTGLFQSNGRLYDTIVVDYLNAGACTYQIDGVLRNGTQDNLSYFALGYRRAGANTIDFINYRDNANGYKDSNTITYAISSTTWINDSYRYITLFDSISQDVEIKLNSFNNNNQNAYNGSEVGGEVNNVFTLVASAFGGLLPILGVYVLPSITLGTLLFIPLVATLVFVIIKIIKK